MAKLKALLPTLREKKRYVAFEVLSKHKAVSPESAAQAIRNGMLSLHGSNGAARAGLMLLPEKYNAKAQRGIARVSNRYVDALKASFVMIQGVENVPAIVRSVGISGSLKKATMYLAG